MLINGFIEGSIRFTSGGQIKLLPFGDKITEATFSYTGELVFAETFGNGGIKSKSAACLRSQEAMFTLSTDDITWAMMQASTGTLDSARSADVPVTESLIVADNEITLSETPISGSVKLSNEAGDQLTFTISGSVITTSGQADGAKVIANYLRAAASERQIEIGSAGRVKESSVYGRFIGCEGTYLVMASRAVVVPKVDFTVGSSPAKVGLDLQCLKDNNGVLATIIKLPEGEYL